MQVLVPSLKLAPIHCARLRDNVTTRVRRNVWLDYPPLAFVGFLLTLIHGRNVTLNRWRKQSRVTGFIHTDPYDIVVGQLRGWQHWHMDDGYMTEEGDVMLVPRDTEHRCQSLNEPSTHLTLGVRK